jgi:hypothetical protein
MYKATIIINAKIQFYFVITKYYVNPIKEDEKGGTLHMSRRDEKRIFSLSKSQKGIDQVADEMYTKDNIKIGSQDIWWGVD